MDDGKYMMEFAFLTAEFYADHPEEQYPEMEHKKDRPYVVIFITVGTTQYAIPMRSHISHPYAYLTDKKNRCGVDYTKAVVVENRERYIDQTRRPYVRPNEFDALRGKEYRIRCGMQKYIEAYKKAKQGDSSRDKMLVSCSTLQYFEQYL